MSRTPSAIAAARRMPLIPMLSLIVGALLVTYIGLIAFVMTYGALQMQSAQAVRDASAHIGTLEARYLGMLTKINQTNPATLGFVKPASIAYVTETSNPTVSMRTY